MLSDTAETFSQIWTSALDVDGGTSYAHTLESTAGPVITVFAIAAGPVGSIYLCGYESPTSGPGGNGFLLRRDPQG